MDANKQVIRAKKEMGGTPKIKIHYRLGISGHFAYPGCEDFDAWKHLGST